MSSERFNNLYDSSGPGFVDFLKWKFSKDRIKPVWPTLSKEKSMTEVKLAERVYGDDIVVTYINHSTLLLQLGGQNILTDPVWSEYAGLFGKIGVRRSIHPGVELDQLPPIDVLLISHSHYDHLDLPTVEFLANRHQPTIVMGLGVGRYIQYCKTNPDKCLELNWWQHWSCDKLEYHFVPAHHWSSRYMFDKNITLWGGFVIAKGKDKVYFAGDTGFGGGHIFHDIKNKYHSFRVSLLPIGAYKPDWFFSYMHTSPHEAVKIFKIIASDYAIPIHFDTFKLTDEEYADPLNDLQVALETEKVNQGKFMIMKPGQSWLVP